MRTSTIGVVSAVGVGLLPFIPWFSLPNSITAKYFFLAGSSAIALLLYATFLFSRREYTLSPKRPLLLLSVLLIGVSTAAAAIGVYFGHSFWGDSARMTGIFFLLHMCAWAFVMGEMFRPGDWGIMRKAVALSAGAYGAVAVLGYYGFGYTGKILWMDLGVSDPLFGNASFAGMYLVLAFILGSIEFVRTKSRNWKIGLGISLALTVISPVLLNIVPIMLGKLEVGEVIARPELLLGLTRASGTVLLVLIAFLIGWWVVARIPLAKVRRAGKILWAAAAVGGCLLGSALLLTPGSFVQNAYLDETTVTRFTVWESTKDAIAERPLLGWGPENYDRIFEATHDPRLYAEAGRIVWFDRAHNVVLDTLATIGFIGAASVLAVVGAYVFVVVRARRREDISEAEAVLLIALPVAHFAQLQTAFDSVPTYALLAVVGGYAFSLERLQYLGKTLTRSARKTAAILLVLAALVGLGFNFLYELPRQMSLTQSLGERNAEVREGLIEHALSRPSDFEGLHTTALSFVVSVFGVLEKTKNEETVLKHAHTFIAEYLSAYERYLTLEPEHYRAKIQYAYLLLVAQEWGGEDRAEEALAIAEEARILSPENPLSDVLMVMALAYTGDVPAARARAEEALTRSPDVQVVKDVALWVNTPLPQRSFLIIGTI